MNKREEQISAIMFMLRANISMMTYYRSQTKDEKSIAICNKSIRESKKALKNINNIKHDEIIDSLFRTLFSNSVQLFVLPASLINGKQIKKWDTTKKGFEEFLYLEEEAKTIAEQKAKERKEQLEAIKKAKEDGKKVDLVYENGKMKPVISEEENKA